MPLVVICFKSLRLICDEINEKLIIDFIQLGGETIINKFLDIELLKDTLHHLV